MLNKFLNVPKLGPFSSRRRPKSPKIVPQTEQEATEENRETSSALKIVHAGGVVEFYYMAMPAMSMMKKYPTCVLARPQVFRRPWDSLVRSHEILTPGEKLYLVPRCTVRKLRRRIKNPNKEEVPALKSFVVSDSSIDVSKDGFKFTGKSILLSDSSQVSGSFTANHDRKKKGTKKHVKFVGIDSSKQKTGSAAAATRKTTDEGTIAKSSKMKLEPQAEGKKKAKHQIVLWQPSLTSIIE